MSDSDTSAIADGEIVKSGQPAVSINSRGLMYGDGCFETFCTSGGRCFRLGAHLQRLRQGLSFLGISYPPALEADALKSTLQQLLEHNKLQDGRAVIRMQVWRAGDRGYATTSSASHYAILCSPVKRSSTDGYRLATVDTRRIPSAALPARFKFTNGLNYIHAARQARQKGADDALMQTTEGAVSETTIANIFWIKEGAVYTPSEACDILPGITRSVVLEILTGALECGVEEGTFGLDRLKSAESVWVCNSVKQICPVSAIDDTAFSTQTPFLQKLQSSFKSVLANEGSSEV